VKPAPVVGGGVVGGGVVGGGVVVFDTFTVRLALAERFCASVTVAVSAREPLATLPVFQLKLGLAPEYTVAPSTLTEKLRRRP